MASQTTPKDSATNPATGMLIHQPYTTAFLARLGTFILRAPLDTVNSIFASPSKCDVVQLNIDPNCPNLRPDALTFATCQRLLRMPNWPSAKASPDIIPIALCLLSRFRLASCGEDASDAKAFSEDFGDDVFIVTSVYVAYKWLTDYGEDDAKDWAVPLAMNKRSLVAVEKIFLEKLDYKIWIPDEEYARVKGRVDELWEKMFKMAEPPTPLPS